MSFRVYIHRLIKYCCLIAINQKLAYLNTTTMKSLITKLFAVVFIALLTVGCAASLTAPQQNIKTQKQTIEKADNPQSGDVAQGRVTGSRPRPNI